MRFQRWVVWFWLGCAAGASAQVVSYSLERQKWLVATPTNAAPLFYAFEARAAGNGLQRVEVSSPAGTNTLEGSSLQRAFSTNFPALTLVGSNVVSGRSLLDASFPLGAFNLLAVSAFTNPITHVVVTRTTNYVAQLTNDFPALDPVITNLPAYGRLAATQTFAWPVFSTNTQTSSVDFTLLEGELDASFVSHLATNGTSALTNLTVLAYRQGLSPTANSATVSGLNTNLDHLALLEFHEQPFQTLVPLGRAGAVSASLTLYRGYPPSAVLFLARSNANAVLTWPTAAGRTYHLIGSDDLASWVTVVASVTTNSQAEYQVILPANEDRRFYRLVSE